MMDAQINQHYQHHGRWNCDERIGCGLVGKEDRTDKAVD
jgi:hypothetical protein